MDAFDGGVIDLEKIGIVSISGFMNYASLFEDGFELRKVVPFAGVVSIRSDDPVVIAAALVNLEGHAATVHLLPHGVDWKEKNYETKTIRIGQSESAIINVGAVQQQGFLETKWVLYSSGTTGTPKAVSHSLQSLSRTVSKGKSAQTLVWGLLYDPNRMAGVQVILQAIGSRRNLIAPPRELSLKEKISFMSENEVSALSATPTLWRQILQISQVEDCSFQQITLGGEIADQKILTGLCNKFPEARIVHIFASTETGAAFTVTDCREGFPAEYLKNPQNEIEFAVRNDILFVRNSASSEAMADGFVSTGDVVEVAGDRVIFKGRASGAVNIGGVVVWPEEVEKIIRSHPDILDAHVAATPNPLVGNLLVASIVVVEHVNSEELRKSLRHWLRDRCPGVMVPAKIFIKDSLISSESGKIQR
jgi:acyl-CoA synthetase (AMP-forming)/AMP-acid ligase II